MGLFGRKKAEAAPATSTTKMSGWIVECGPLCGFMVRDHNQKELGQLVMAHMKNTHKTNLTEAEALKDAKAITW